MSRVGSIGDDTLWRVLPPADLLAEYPDLYGRLLPGVIAHPENITIGDIVAIIAGVASPNGLTTWRMALRVIGARDGDLACELIRDVPDLGLAAGTVLVIAAADVAFAVHGPGVCDA